MALDNLLEVYDENGVKQDYDILADDVKFQPDGKDLPTKLAEMQHGIDDAGQVNEIVMNGEHYTPTNKVIDLGTVITQHQDISGKVDKEQGKGLSTNDYTTAEKDKLAGLSAQVQSDWEESDTSSPAYIQHKPTIPTAINGKSAYQSYLDTTTDNPKKTEEAWIASLKGEKGDKGDTGNCQITGDGGNIVSLIVNDLTTGGAGNILSAEMGKRLALMSGTYAQAWARSKAIPSPFCWIWDETVGSDVICKPIWHKGNSVFVDATGAVVSVDAPSSVPVAPTMTINGTAATSGGSYGKNAELVITPATNSALYWRIGSGSWNVSDVAVTFTLPSGTLTIEAYCANQAGNSQTTSISVTIAGTATPSFTPASGTTINNGVVSRGGSVVVSVPQGGELHYCINGGSWTTASGLSVSIPIADNLNQGQMVVEAYNVEDGDESSHVTNTYTMAALAAPTFSQADGYVFPTFEGGKVTINIPAGATNVYYTTNGDTPTTSSTEYTSGDEITVAQSMTLKAIAVDALGTSVVATASYTVPVDHKFQFKIKLTASNSTEFIPVTNSNAPKYTMTVDWGDNSPVEEYTNQGFSKKGLSHAYNGALGDEYTITLRGTSIPVLIFCDGDCCNKSALYEIVENSLTCDTLFNTETMGCFSGCTGLTALSADALQNNIGTIFSLYQTALSSIPSGFLSHLTKNGHYITDFQYAFRGMTVVFSNDMVTELKSSISHATKINSMFNSFNGTIALPDDFFDGITNGTVTQVNSLFQNAKSGLTGDAYKLYLALADKIESSDVVHNYVFSGGQSGLSNIANVPGDWKIF